MLHTQRRELSEPGVLALKWRISRKHLLQLLISNLAVEPLQPEAQAQGPELNEVNSVFEAVSAFGTVGLSVGVTPLMNPFARVVTMLTMFIGRVGPVSLAISLSARKDSAAARRAVQPQAHINVG